MCVSFPFGQSNRTKVPSAELTSKEAVILNDNRHQGVRYVFVAY